MKLIEAIIKPVKLEAVKAALRSIEINEFTERPLVCHGRHKGQAMLFRGAEYMLSFVEKVKLEIIVADDAVGKIVEAIGTIARTEKREDCRIYILPFVEAVYNHHRFCKEKLKYPLDNRPTTGTILT